MKNQIAILKRVRFLLLFFIIALSLAGLTAIPLQHELALLNEWFGVHSFLQNSAPSMAQ